MPYTKHIKQTNPMNLKALALATVAAIGTATPALAQNNRIGGGWAAGAAQRQGNPVRFCNFTSSAATYWMERDEHACSVSSYISEQGHKVWEVSTHDLTTQVLLWADGTAEYWQEGRHFTGTWSNSNGYTEVLSDVPHDLNPRQSAYSFRF